MKREPKTYLWTILPPRETEIMARLQLAAGPRRMRTLHGEINRRRKIGNKQPVISVYEDFLAGKL